MPKIQLLDRSVAELIAAGEVVERPASVIKELVENSIDAGAHRITVEIQRGGVSLIRVTDDGCGIAPEDVPLAFLRHATSKIRSADDLDAIATLGFRGEALAATSAVARVELFTRAAGEQEGVRYCIEGGQETLNEASGCPAGTTVVVRDLFYNTPARMKFLKKDVSEGNAVAAVIDRAALSHPEISFKLIREGRQTLLTPGDGRLETAAYSVLGREAAASLIPVGAEHGGVTVTGLTCKPVSCRQSRAFQYVFLNGRFVHSGTVMAAAEQAYKNSAMVGKFPVFALNISLPFGAVDVNVHPAKTEVRFSDERRVFEAVLFAVRAALAAGDTRPVIRPDAAKRPAPFTHMTAEEYRQQVLPEEPAVPSRSANITPHREPAVKDPSMLELHSSGPVIIIDDTPRRTGPKIDIVREVGEPLVRSDVRPPAGQTERGNKPPAPLPKETPAEQKEPENPVEEKPVRLVGEAYRTYIIVEQGDSIFIIDKHAAHERILFEELKAAVHPETQLLLAPQQVRLGREEYDAAISNLPLLARAGFEAEDFGNSTLLVRAVPASLAGEDAISAVREAAASLAVRGGVELERLERLYHTVACKAATKAGFISGAEELLHLANQVLSRNDIMYCPHGRPVAFEIRRRDLEKQFGRIQ